MPAQETVTDKVSKSAVALVLRLIFVFIINIVGGIFLARLLTPTEFGIYAIALFAFNFIRVFGDAGLGASLIRSKNKPTQSAYASIYTIQQGLVIGVVIIFWFLAPWIVQQYALAESYVMLFRLIALALVAVSFMVIPQVQLERNLAFDKLAVVEAVQAVAFNVVAVWLAFNGYGAFALGWGFLARAVSGTILVNIIQPWHISYQFNWPAVKEHLKFGVSFQATNFISTLNTAINPILIAMIFGVSGAGYVEWAVLVAGYLQRPFSLFNRLLYPAFSKLRENTKKLSRALNYSYVATGFIFFALAGLLFGLAPEIVHVVYTDKWLPALPLLYLLIIAHISIPMYIPNGALGYALGWSQTILYLNIAFSVSLWVAVIAFINITDSYIAFGYAKILTAFIHLILYFMLKRKLADISIIKTQLLFLISAVLTAFSLMQITVLWSVTGWVSLIVNLLIGGGIYLLYSALLYAGYYVFTKDDLLFEAVKFLFKNMINKMWSFSR